MRPAIPAVSLERQTETLHKKRWFELTDRYRSSWPQAFRLS